MAGITYRLDITGLTFIPTKQLNGGSTTKDIYDNGLAPRLIHVVPRERRCSPKNSYRGTRRVEPLARPSTDARRGMLFEEP